MVRQSGVLTEPVAAIVVERSNVPILGDGFWHDG